METETLAIIGSLLILLVGLYWYVRTIEATEKTIVTRTLFLTNVLFK